jgi:hypothetical protein
MSGYDRYAASQQVAAHTNQEPTAAAAQLQQQEDMSLAFGMDLLDPPHTGEPTSASASITAALASVSQAVQRGDMVMIGAIVLATSVFVFFVRVTVNMRKSQWLVDPAADAPTAMDSPTAVITAEKVQLLKSASAPKMPIAGMFVLEKVAGGDDNDVDLADPDGMSIPLEETSPESFVRSLNFSPGRREYAA